MDQVEVKDGKIPLGLCKQAALKLDSFMADCHEIIEDPDLDPEDKDTFNTMIETASLMAAHIVNIVSKEIGEEEFLNENIPMDDVGTYPGDDEDILDVDLGI